MASKKTPKDPSDKGAPKAAGNGSQRPKKTPMGRAAGNGSQRKK